MTRTRWLAPIVLASGLCGLHGCSDRPAGEVVLRSRGGTRDGLRLADGAIVPAGADADLEFYQAMVMSLRSPTPASICARGTVAAVGDIAAGDDCPGQDMGWAQFVYLDAASTHTLGESQVRGLGLVVLDRAHQARYRVRVVGDAYSAVDGASVVLEYEPAP